jgi:hypothetical protein
LKISGELSFPTVLPSFSTGANEFSTDFTEFSTASHVSMRSSEISVDNVAVDQYPQLYMYKCKKNEAKVLIFRW